MIVLDEQLLGRGIEASIKQWYGGPVRSITDLRPDTVIKDDAIPALLRRHAGPTFVTINVKDFWGKVDIDQRFCVVCFNLVLPDAGRIPRLLHLLFRCGRFNTKKQRMGHVFRMDPSGKVKFYRYDNRERRTFAL